MKDVLSTLVVFVSLVAVSLTATTVIADSPKKITRCKTITQPGSYLVTRNLKATGDCIVIRADFVTIDLNGFVLVGNEIGDGITDDCQEHNGIEVRNGSVTGFNTGIHLPLSANCVVERIRATDNTLVGIHTHDGCTVNGNVASFNGQNGIRADDSSIVSDNVTRGNGFQGIIAQIGSLVSGNTSSRNGADGIKVDRHCLLIGNNAYSNGANGLNVDCPTNIINNTATSNRNANLRLSGNGCETTNNLAP